MSDVFECLHCGEFLMPDDIVDPIIYIGESGPEKRYRHQACAIRVVIGGLNHLRGTCQCDGGPDEPDPPEMTKREAALAAVAYWRSTDR
jgi:hypothetical protein